MSYAALVHAFSKREDLPIPVDEVLDWIKAHTDHKDLRLHPVDRHKKAFRGAFRRIGVPAGRMYSQEYDIICQILYGADLPDDWKRLVIVKEALHVFDPAGSQVNTPELLQKLIPAVIAPELGRPPFMPALDDYLGPFRAMAVLLPREARRKFAAAVANGTRTSTEIADFVKLPDYYVSLWLDVGELAENQLAGF